MKTINNIKNLLIRLLGGITAEESNRLQIYRFYCGAVSGYCCVVSEMQKQYGKPADEWCNNVYNFVKKELNKNVTLKHHAAKGTIKGEWVKKDISKYK